ncbi:hypothetical protein PLEOSDRAFT_1110157 [Pleurotus ostreatus PC15]|uniref:3'-5' exonuclease n=1 Tax=Pleurotus ostreatus (strain PC15) TaxID=1137138 RepID=A0A067N1Z4_PLEO1|nr:hypothetical protein PLEOSDRAFT_1110157 [Pleurotus ostreatus PC15]
MSSNLSKDIGSLSLQEEAPLSLLSGPLEPGFAATFTTVANSLGLAQLPWFTPLDILEISSTNECRRKLLRKQLFQSHREAGAWVADPSCEENRASLVLCSILTQTLLAFLEGDAAIDRYPCDAFRLPDGQIKFSTSISDTLTKLRDWPSTILGKALRAMETERKKHGKGPADSIPPGDDSVSNLFSIFNKYKKRGLYAKILANIVIAAMGLQYSMDGVDLPEYWDEVSNITGLNPTDILEYKSQYGTYGPRIILLPIHLAATLSPLLLLMTKDLMAKSISRHSHLLMWRHLGSARPSQLVAYEDVIWRTVHSIAIRPSSVDSSMKQMFERLKQLSQFDPAVKDSNFGIEAEAASFFVQLEPLLRSSTPPADGPLSSKPGPSKPRPTASPAHNGTPPPAADPPMDVDGDGQPPSENPQPGGKANADEENGPDGGQDGRRSITPPPAADPPMRVDSPTAEQSRDQNNDGDDSDADVRRNDTLGPQQDTRAVDNVSDNDMYVENHPVEPSAGRDTGGHGLDEGGDTNDPPTADEAGEPSGVDDNEDLDTSGAGRSGGDPNSAPLRIIIPPRKLKRGRSPAIEPESGHSKRTRSTTFRPRGLPSPPHRRTTRLRSSTIQPQSQLSPPAAKSSSSITVRRRSTRKPTTTPTVLPVTNPSLPPLVGTSKEHRFLAPPQSLYDIRGGAVEFLPSFHNESHVQSILALIRGIRRSYGDSAPPYTTGKEGILIKPVSYHDYKAWQSSGQLGDELKSKVILVTGVPHPNHKTLDEAVRDLSISLDAPLICHDQSVEMGAEGNEQHRETTLAQLIDISQSPDAKSLNFLDIPGPIAADVPLVHDDTLDRACYPMTWDVHQARQSADMTSLQWTIAATPWSWHHLHMDTNGFGTLAMSTYGRKLWAVFRCKGDTFGTRPIDWQINPGLLDDNVLDSEEYEVDYAILEPGAALVMPGGCPHMVVTLDDSTVFMGRHFYQGRSIRRHMFSFVHSACIPLSTNTDHNQCAASIIRRLVAAFRAACFTLDAIPARFRSQFADMKTTEGIKDTLVVCVVGRLLPAIFKDDKSFNDDLVVASTSSLALIQQIQASDAHRFKDSNGRPLDFYEDIYVLYLRHVCSVYIRLLSWSPDSLLTGAHTRLSKIPETKGYEPMLNSSSESVDLGDSDLNLDVDVADDALTVVSHLDGVANALGHLNDAAQASRFFGFDIEHASDHRVRLVQLATPLHVYVFDLFAIGEFPAALQDFLKDANLVKMGVDTYGDARILYRSNAVTLRGGGELSRLHRIHDMSGALANVPFKQNVALATLTSVWLDLELDKSLQNSDWGSQLTINQYRYAALDTVAGFKIYQAMMLVPQLATVRASYWIFEDIDHFTNTRLGLRDDHPAYAAKSPQLVNVVTGHINRLEYVLSSADLEMGGSQSWSSINVPATVAFYQAVSSALATYRSNIA